MTNEERPPTRRGGDRRDRKKDWVRVQSEIDAAIDQSEELTVKHSPR